MDYPGIVPDGFFSLSEIDYRPDYSGHFYGFFEKYWS
jgi:hypothetical protein